jgi:hypothetical protein
MADSVAFYGELELTEPQSLQVGVVGQASWLPRR